MDEGENKTVEVSKDMAQKEFEDYCEANDLDCNIDGMNDEDKKSLEKVRKRFIRACMQGRVKVNGQLLVYTISDFSPNGYKGREIEIKRPGGHAFAGMDGYKETQNVHRLNGFLSAMTGQEVVFFSKIDGSDWQFFRDISLLFLAD